MLTLYVLLRWGFEPGDLIPAPIRMSVDVAFIREYRNILRVTGDSARQA